MMRAIAKMEGPKDGRVDDREDAAGVELSGRL